MRDPKGSFVTEGSLARSNCHRKPNIIVMPNTDSTVTPYKKNSHIKNMLHASEMYCSLLSEDVHGCAYGKLTIYQAGALGSFITAFGLLCIFIGA